MKSWIRLLRPHQWVKNGFVLAPLVFSGRAVEPAAVLAAAAAFLAFCALASGVYALNDVFDREADREHPTKHRRPVAAGEIRVRDAALGGGILVAAGLVAMAAVDPAVGAVGAVYLVLNGLYNVRLKEVVLVDVFAVGAFFVLRLLAGSAAIDVTPSVWLLVCGGLLALYLGFAKRRYELHLLGEDSHRHRGVLAEYSSVLLDQISVVLLAVTVVAYLMYTVSSETAEAVGADALAYSVVFILYGVFRHLFLVHEHDRGSPTETLLTDPALVGTVLLWILYCGWILYGPL